ncbi:MAG: hypothetical protein GX640_14010 [Fibrobacter sp.]|nr:hypothetical protein [Fibrobacter sp.]
MRISLFYCFVISLALSCASNKVEPQTEPVSSGSSAQFIWKPNVFKDDFYSEQLNAYSSISFSVSSCQDIREQKEVIGESTDLLSKQTSSIITRINLADWCRRNLPNALNFLNIKSNLKNGIILECELRSFSIKDDQSLHAEIKLGVVAKGKNDILVWEGSIQGASDLYLKPAGSNGLSECISNTLIITVYNLLNEPSFRDAVIKSTL